MEGSLGGVAVAVRVMDVGGPWVSDTVSKALDVMSKHGISGVPVLDSSGSLVGIFSDAGGIRTRTHQASCPTDTCTRIS